MAMRSFTLLTFVLLLPILNSLSAREKQKPARGVEDPSGDLLIH